MKGRGPGNPELALLCAEFSDAENDSERFEIAGKIVDLDGQHDSADLSDMEIISAALKIVRSQSKSAGTSN